MKETKKSFKKVMVSRQNAHIKSLVERSASYVRTTGLDQFFNRRDAFRCQFHQLFLHDFFVQKSFLAAFSSCVLALAPKFCTKNARVNVDEIDGSNQDLKTIIPRLKIKLKMY